MECSAYQQKLYIEFFSCLPAKLICPEEDAMRVVEQQSRAELPEKSGRLASQLTLRDSIFYALKLRRWCWFGTGIIILGRRNVGPGCTDISCLLSGIFVRPWEWS